MSLYPRQHPEALAKTRPGITQSGLKTKPSSSTRRRCGSGAKKRGRVEQQLWEREGGVLTQVSALDGAVAEGDAEVVTCLPQLGNGHAVRAADYPRLVIILPFSAEGRT